MNNANRELGPNPGTVGTGSSTGSWPKLSSEGADSPTIVSGRASASSSDQLAVAWPQIGDRIDAFVIRQTLGAGGMGAVYLADDTRLDRPVALKLLPPEQSRDSDAVQRFYQEGRAAARLDHENIARVHALGCDGRYHYIAFECVDGANVRRRIDEQGALSVDETIRIALQIALALQHAHERGVVHRDVKPSNILIRRDGLAKLVDMGLARRFEQGKDDGLTQSNMTLGTFDYISPEQAVDPRLADVRSDLYSLGCAMFHMLTGRPPFAQGNVIQKLLQHQEEAPADLRALNPAIPPALARIVAKLMAKDPESRYQTPEPLARDLAIVAEALRIPLRDPSPFASAASWRLAQRLSWKERSWLWGVPVASLCAAIALIVAARPRDDAAPAGFQGVTLPEIGKSAESDPARRTASSVSNSAPSPNSSGGNSANPANADASPSATAAESNGNGATAANSGSRRREVRARDDLRTILKTAPNKSEIVLVDAGPYVLRFPSTGSGAKPETASASAIDLTGRELTLRRDRRIPNAPRPKLRVAVAALNSEPNSDADLRNGAAPVIFEFAGGKITIDGLDFELEAVGENGLSASATAVAVRDSALTMTDCAFLAGDRASRGSALVPALRIVSSSAPRSALLSPPLIDVAGCDFGPSAVGIETRGCIALAVQDTAFRGCGSALRLINPYHENQPPAPGEVELSHVTIVTGQGPALRCEGGAPRITMKRSAVGPPADRPEDAPVLLSASDPSQIQWLGRDNLYSRIDAYLVGENDALAFEAVRDWSDWANSARHGQRGVSRSREFHSAATTASLWALSHTANEGAGNGDGDGPSANINSNSKTQTIRLAQAPSGADGELMEIGARSGPFGDIPQPQSALDPFVATLAVSTETAATPDKASPNADGAPIPRATVKTEGNAANSGSEPATDPSAKPRPEPEPVSEPDPLERMPMTPMIDLGSDADQEPAAVAENRKPENAERSPLAAPETNPNSAANPGANPNPAPPPPVVDAVAAPIIRTAEDLKTAFRNAKSGEGRQRSGGEIVLRIASDADLSLTPQELTGSASWRLIAEPPANPNAPSRPRLRLDAANADWLRPIPLRGLLAGNRGLSLFRIGGGVAMSLEGIEIILANNSPLGVEASPQSAFRLSADASLKLKGCVLTLESHGLSRSRLIALQADPGAAGKPPTVRLEDCVLRSEGDVIESASQIGAVVELSNVAIAAEGAFFRASGLRPGAGAGAVCRLDLNRVTSFTRDALIRLESHMDAPTVAAAEVKATSCLFAAEAPLCQLSGFDGLETLRGRLRWHGESVVYHDVEVMRVEESGQGDTLPKSVSAAEWPNLADVAESSPRFEEAALKPWPEDRKPSAMTRRDLEALKAGSGADWGRLPNPHDPNDDADLDASANDDDAAGDDGADREE